MTPDFTARSTQPPPITDPAVIRKICAMKIPAKMDITLKFSELPKARFGAGVASFAVEADGRVILIELKRKTWLKLETAVSEWPEWVAVVQGKMGEPFDGGFMLREPGLQVFEKKPKAPKEESKAESAITNSPVSDAVESAPEVAPPKQATTYPKLSLKSKKSGG
jgi:hypothetical protein